MKHLNLFIFLIVSTIFLSLSSQIKFSTNFLEVFFSKESIKLFSVASKLGLSDNIFIAKKGFSRDSLDELYLMASKLEKIDGISRVDVSLLPSKKIQNYYKNNYYLLADFNSTIQTEKSITKALQKEYDNLQNSFLYIPLDTNDPLGLFKLKFNLHERYLKLKDYGYVIKAKTSIDTASAKEAKVLYDKINLLLKEHKETIAYASFFFLVENSSYIRSDTQNIIVIATLLLLLLYFLLLKNHKLLLNSILAIATSVMSAIIVSAFVMGDVNIMVLAFGISITTISIDYMFHYYFHGNFTQRGFIKQREVFFGFATTFGVFVIFSFIDIRLFYELSFFSLVSLLSAYLIFSLAFSYLDIAKPIIDTKSTQKDDFKGFNPIYIALISIILFAYSYNTLTFDDNLRNLDYNNEKLLKLSKKFNEGLEQNHYQNILLSAKSKEALLQLYEKLEKKHPNMLGIGKFIFSHKKCQERVATIKKYDFNRVKKIINEKAQKIGFKDAFKESYKNIQDIECKMQLSDEMNFKIVKNLDRYYTIAFIDKDEKVEFKDGVELFDVVGSLAKDMQKSKETIIEFMFISLVFILSMLFLVSGLNILYPLIYILFPLSVVLFFISLFGTINIMHLFALIILIAIGIDYGVYMHNTKTLSETRTAIKYALLSTLAGFGVLIFSDTVALHSIGFVITIGVGAIFILLYRGKI